MSLSISTSEMRELEAHLLKRIEELRDELENPKSSPEQTAFHRGGIDELRHLIAVLNRRA